MFNKCETHISSFISLKSKGGLRYPRKDTVKICEVTHKVISLLKVTNRFLGNNCFENIIHNSLKNLNMNVIFIEFDSHVLDCEVLENHKYFIIKLIIQIIC